VDAPRVLLAVERFGCVRSSVATMLTGPDRFVRSASLLARPSEMTVGSVGASTRAASPGSLDPRDAD
jgi:hypothetical protein